MDLSKTSSAQLAKKVRQYITAGLSLNESLGEAVAHVDEMERRLEEADSCICWGRRLRAPGQGAGQELRGIL